MPSSRAAAEARLLNRPPRFVTSSRSYISYEEKSEPGAGVEKGFGLILWSQGASRKAGRVRGMERSRVAAPARRRGFSRHLPLALGRAALRSLPPAAAEGLRGALHRHLPPRESGPAEDARRRPVPHGGAGLFPLRSSAPERRAAS